MGEGGMLTMFVICMHSCTHIKISQLVNRIVFAPLVASCIVDKSGTSSYTPPSVDAHSE